MKIRVAVSVLFCIALFASVAPAQEPPAATPADQPAEQPVEQPTDVAKTPDGPAPKLKLSTTEWDFGSKWSGEPCETEVVIENAGDATLKIINVRSSCGCTVAQPTKRVLEPGESDKMTIKYNTKKNKKEVSQTITIESNDPTQPRVPILVKGVVQELFESSPSNRLTFGRLEREDAASKTIELTNNMEKPVTLKIQSVSNPVPFDIKLEEGAPGKQYKLTAVTKPPLKIGANVADVVLETGLDEFPTITYSVSAYVAPRVAVMPSRLYVSPRVTKEFKRIIRVSYRPDKPLKITAIKTSNPDLIKAELDQRPPADVASSVTRYHMITVTLPAGSDMPEGGGWIEIQTDDPSPEYQKFVVEVMLRQAPSRVLNPAAKPGAEPAAPEPKPTVAPEEPEKDDD